MASSDEAVQLLVFDVHRIVQLKGISTVLCALANSQGHRMHIVPVPVHAGFEHAPRPIDLQVSAYLERMERRDALAFDINDSMSVVDRPAAASGEVGSWTVFSSYDPFEHVNTLVRTFPGGEELSPHIRGSYLVAKAGPDGLAINVTDRDLVEIQSVLIRLLLAVPPLPEDSSDSSDSSSD